MGFKKWKILKTEPLGDNIEKVELTPFVSKILAGRKLSVRDLQNDHLTLSEALENPFALKDMDKAVERISSALQTFEQIAIYGDYDCDGVTSTVILYTYLQSMGANVFYYIPERDSGYGLNKKAIKSLHAEGTQLIITVDNGITALEEIAYAKELGIDVVVTDHHQPLDTLPVCAAVVDPHRSDCASKEKNLAGVGVAFKLIAALEEGQYDTAFEYFGEFVAIGTIGDVMELTGENRVLVRKGLKLLNISDNLGLHALIKIGGLRSPINSQSVAFGIVPRINAAGRLDSASKAVDLFLSDDPEEAEALAEEIHAYNIKRKMIEDAILADIDRMLSQSPQILSQRVLVLSGDNWHHGVIGIVSSRILEKYGKPNILLSIEGDMARGSGRSIGDFSLFEALKSCDSVLEKFGGHALAAGVMLKVENIQIFEEMLLSYAKIHHDTMPCFTYTADTELSTDELTIQNIRDMEILQPFGTGNHPPLFLIKEITIQAISSLSGDKHLRIQFQKDDTAFQALYFRMSRSSFPYKTGQLVDLLVTMDINEYNGSVGVSIKIKDIHPTGFKQNAFFAAKDVYEKIMRKEPYDLRLQARILPTREQIGIIYKHLRKHNGYAGDIDMLYVLFMESGLNYCKYRIILHILEEVGLIYIPPSYNKIEMLSVCGKVDLNNSLLLQSLQQQNCKG